ncbi:MAG: hypothetical protein ACM3MH_00840 [Actinomycetota bacterium]
MPQILFLFAAGAGLLLARRWYAHEQRRVQAELRAAEEALARRDAAAIPLERDPKTGIYRPKQAAHNTSR